MESLTRLLNTCHLLQGKVIALIGDSAPDSSDIEAVGDLIGQCSQLYDEFVAETKTHTENTCTYAAVADDDPNRTALISDFEAPDADPNRTAIIEDVDLDMHDTVAEDEHPVQEQPSVQAAEVESIAIDDLDDLVASEREESQEMDIPADYPDDTAEVEEDMPTVIAEEQAEDDQYISLDDLSSVEPEESGVIRVDEMLQRRAANDLRRMFTLNDKYRFRRELFGNSDAAFNDAIDIVSAMHSMDEVREYFSLDMGWNLESDDVKDFLDVIATHFQ